MIASSTKRMDGMQWINSQGMQGSKRQTAGKDLLTLAGPLRVAGASTKKPRVNRGFFRNRNLCAVLLGDHADEGVLLDTLLAEVHPAVRLGEQRVVGAGADVVTGAINRAALAHQDVAGQHLLSAKLLDAEALRL